MGEIKVANAARGRETIRNPHVGANGMWPALRGTGTAAGHAGLTLPADCAGAIAALLREAVGKDASGT
jgi:hypothetical protein